MSPMYRIECAAEYANHQQELLVTVTVRDARQQQACLRLLANMTVTYDDIFLRGKAFKADRAPNMNLVCADSDFRT